MVHRSAKDYLVILGILVVDVIWVWSLVGLGWWVWVGGFGLVGLGWWVWVGGFGLVGLGWWVWVGGFGLVGLGWWVWVGGLVGLVGFG